MNNIWKLGRSFKLTKQNLENPSSFIPFQSKMRQHLLYYSVQITYHCDLSKLNINITQKNCLSY